MNKEIKYKVIDGTSFKENTPDNLCNLLNELRENRTRIVVDYGNVKTGKSWEEVYDISGYIGRSTGSIKIPLLVHNSRSFGGGSLLDDCILSIKTSKGKKEIYHL
jgi:hypothetical protein